MRFIRTLFIFLSFNAVLYSDVKTGKTLLNEGSCLECHNLEDYKNNKTKIKKFKQLEARVQACQLAGDDGLFDDEVHSISKYLNKEFYKLKK